MKSKKILIVGLFALLITGCQFNFNNTIGVKSSTSSQIKSDTSNKTIDLDNKKISDVYDNIAVYMKDISSTEKTTTLNKIIKKINMKNQMILPRFNLLLL